MTQDEIIIAQQARIEQLREALQHFALIDLGRDSLPSTFGMDVLASRKALSTPDDLSALRAHDVALENCRLFAARNRNEEWAKTILRFCGEAGIIGSPLRAGAIEKGGV